MGLGKADSCHHSHSGPSQLMQRDSEFRKGKSAGTCTTSLHTAMNFVLLTHNGLSVCYFRRKLQTSRKGWETSKLQGKCPLMYDAIPQLLPSCQRKDKSAQTFSRNWFLRRILVLAARVRKIRISVNHEKLNRGNRFYPTYCQWAVTSWVSQSLQAYTCGETAMFWVSDICWTHCSFLQKHPAKFTSAQGLPENTKRKEINQCFNQNRLLK